MTFITYLLVALEAICSILLIGIVLLQQSKGEGLGTAFGGGGGGDSLFGARAGNVLTKATVVLACVFMLNTLVLGIIFSRTGTSSVFAAERQAAAQQQPMQQQQPAAPPAQQPAMPQPEITLEQPAAPALPEQD